MLQSNLTVVLPKIQAIARINQNSTYNDHPK